MVAAPYQPVDRALAGQLQRTEDLLEDLDIHPKFVESATEDLGRWVRERRVTRDAFSGRYDWLYHPVLEELDGYR